MMSKQKSEQGLGGIIHRICFRCQSFGHDKNHSTMITCIKDIKRQNSDSIFLQTTEKTTRKGKKYKKINEDIIMREQIEINYKESKL